MHMMRAVGAARTPQAATRALVPRACYTFSHLPSPLLPSDLLPSQYTAQATGQVAPVSHRADVSSAARHARERSPRQPRMF